MPSAGATIFKASTYIYSTPWNWIQKIFCTFCLRFYFCACVFCIQNMHPLFNSCAWSLHLHSVFCHQQALTCPVKVITEPPVNQCRGNAVWTQFNRKTGMYLDLAPWQTRLTSCPNMIISNHDICFPYLAEALAVGTVLWKSICPLPDYFCFCSAYFSHISDHLTDFNIRQRQPK